jgi:hypothetical protein
LHGIDPERFKTVIIVNDSVYLTPFSIESDSLLLQQDIISLDEENDTDMGK